jgi:putative ABC transport system permease protein
VQYPGSANDAFLACAGSCAMIAVSDLFRISLRQVLRQRSFGVIFSIALGITAFIVLAVLGREIRYKIGQDMVLMGGVNVIQIYMDDIQYPGQPLREFYPETVEALRALPGVTLVSQNIRYGKYFVLRGEGERKVHVNFIGVDQFFADVYALTLEAGRLFQTGDIEKRRRVCMLGRDAAKNLYGSSQASVGKLLFLGQDIFEVVGVVSGIMMGSWSQGGFLPYTSQEDRNWGSGRVDRLFIRSVGWEDVPALMKLIPKTVHAQQSAPYLVLQAQEDQLERLKSTFMWVEMLLWLGIAAALMLGGFGIWYGTFSAVRARTREVGLKKAMGGADVDILAQFLSEALCKAVAGGLLGIVLGGALVELGSYLLDTDLSYALLFASSLGSILFSALIGVAGGLYPALQASRMDVVTALRFE